MGFWNVGASNSLVRLRTRSLHVLASAFDLCALARDDHAHGGDHDWNLGRDHDCDLADRDRARDYARDRARGRDRARDHAHDHDHAQEKVSGQENVNVSLIAAEVLGARLLERAFRCH